MGHYAVSVDNLLPTFRDTVLALYSKVDLSKKTFKDTLFKIRPIRCFETSVTSYPVAGRSMPEGRNPQLKSCGKLKPALKT